MAAAVVSLLEGGRPQRRYAVGHAPRKASLEISFPSTFGGGNMKEQRECSDRDRQAISSENKSIILYDYVRAALQGEINETLPCRASRKCPKIVATPPGWIENWQDFQPGTQALYIYQNIAISCYMPMFCSVNPQLITFTDNMVARAASGSTGMATYKLSLLALLFLAGRTKAVGEPCQISNSRLDPNAHKFRSDCGPQDYCAVSLANTGSMSAAIKHITPKNDAAEQEPVPKRVDSVQRRSHVKESMRHLHSGLTPHKHKTMISRRGELQNIFLAAVAETYANDTVIDDEANEPQVPMISEKDDGAPSPFGLNATGTCQPKGCRKDEFPFG